MADMERWQLMKTTAESAAQEDGRVLQSWRSRFSVSEKSRSNLVTDADLDSQNTIVKILEGAFPDHRFLGEEGLSKQDTDSEYQWIVDPLDGTGNYVHGFPYYCVSIGLEYQGRLILGVIYDPTRDELYSAVEGCGATRNGESLSVSGTESLSKAMCVASLPVAGDPEHPAFKRFVNVLPHAQTLQRLGSAALNLAYLASGNLDAFWSTTLYPWDIAAGVVIVREAGGTATGLDASALDVHQGVILATSSTQLQSELLPLLNT